MRILAIDPGETCGLAYLEVEQHWVDISTAQGEAYTPGLFQCSPVTVQVAAPGNIYDWLSRNYPGRDVDAVICEEFRLYPWLARQQGFSTLPTVEVIGVIKYLTALKGIPLHMQRADVKKEGRDIASRTGWDMVERSMGSGRGKYRGPDFNYPGPQHPRDALAHGVWWAFRSEFSPIRGRDEHG